MKIDWASDEFDWGRLSAGLQATYVRAGIDVRYMESIRNDSVAFMKTVVRGMERHDGQGV